MEINAGKSYHIKDSFFDRVNDSNLMHNKENGHYRPHFFFMKDPNQDEIFWAIPQSSKAEKYKKIVLKNIKKYGQCNTIVIANFDGKENAFLIQNMFPIIGKYVSHEHTKNGTSVTIHKSTIKEITSNALVVLELHKKGKKIVFTNIAKIYAIMQKELEN